MDRLAGSAPFKCVSQNAATDRSSRALRPTGHVHRAPVATDCTLRHSGVVQPRQALVRLTPQRIALGRRTTFASRHRARPNRLHVRAYFENFDDGAVTAVKEATDQAKLLKAPAVTSEHLLLGLTLCKDPTSDTLASAGVTSDAVRQKLAAAPASSGNGARTPFWGGGGRGGMGKGDIEVVFSQELEGVFAKAVKTAKAANPDARVSTKVLMFAAVFTKDGPASTLLKAMQVDVPALEQALAEQKELVGAGRRGGKFSAKDSVLAKCGVDLTAQAEAGMLDPCVGREEEVQRMMRILVRRRKNNPCLIGEPGVGKTAVAEGLAQRIVQGRVPARLAGKRVVSLQLGLLVADTKYRGEFEERLKNVLEEAISRDDLILFIDELHMLVGVGAADGGMDGGNIMKPALARGELQCIGATTISEYRLHIEKDAALERRFQPVKVMEPTPADTVDILQGLANVYEGHHGVQYSQEALEAAVRYSIRYIPDRYLPDKAIDILDEAGAVLQLTQCVSTEEDSEDDVCDVEADLEVREEHVREVVAQWTGIPVQKLSASDTEKLLELEGALRARVVGQEYAVTAIAKAIRRGRSGLLNATRPVASFIFSGPTGVGKTELAKALADAYYGSAGAMVRIDMSEYMEPQSVSRLIGPPPGYVGYDQGGQLTEAVRTRPHCVVLLDEVEKAHPDVFNLLLQVLEDARLTDNKGRVVSFSNVVLIMTSNIGSEKIMEAIDAPQGEAGGSGGGGEGAEGGAEAEEAARRVAYSRMQVAVKQELQAQYRPEFLNRLDEIIVFEPLGRPEVEVIAGYMVQAVQLRVLDQGIAVEVGAGLRALMVEQGYTQKFGARPLRRAVQRLLEDSLSQMIIEGFVTSGSSVHVDTDAAAANIQATRGDGQTHLQPIDYFFSGGIEDTSAPGKTDAESPSSSSGGNTPEMESLMG